ncbi:MAG: CBS domain-containing protein [Clostridia bacterium]|jgi:CBS domain-containing protein|nr:CBS domain-containing protein [Clostridia bacterium]
MNAAFFLIPKSQVATLEDDDTFRQGLEKMRYHGYTAIPVLTKQGKYVGTLSEGDLLWNLVDIGGASLEECEDLHIADILRPDRNPPVKITAKAEELLEQLMTHNFLPVTDDEGAFIGIVTRHRMLEYYKNIKQKK